MTAAANRARCLLRRYAPVGLILVVAMLTAGTIKNQLAINKANDKLSVQARNGQRALNRQCALVPIAKKIYADELDRGRITAADYDLVVSSAAAVCPVRPVPRSPQLP